MNLLVTGGAGYIGSCVAARLVEEGHTVTILDDLSTGHRDAVPQGAQFVEGRIHDAGDVLRGGGFDAVVHLAAFSLVSESVAHPDRYEENNVAGTAKLCDAMRSAGVDRIVVSSSAAVYGEPASSPIDESTEAVPVNPYGRSKLAVDRDLTVRARASGLGAISLRYFNVAGAYGRYGERHDPETHLIPLALDVASGHRSELVVYGSDYPTPDGTCVRDYVHVLDIANAHLLALHALEPGRHEIVNLGNGSGFSVEEVLDAVRSVTGQAIPVVLGSASRRRPGSSRRVQRACPSRPSMDPRATGDRCHRRRRVAIRDRAHVVTAAFVSAFAREPDGLWATPGRLNIIGEFTDYNEGFVLPMALDAVTHRGSRTSGRRHRAGRIEQRPRRGRARRRDADRGARSAPGWVVG